MIWFSCHQYAVLDVGGVDYVFDACAGPFGGDCLRADYLNRAIDRSGCEFFLLSQVRFSRRRLRRTQKCGQLDLSPRCNTQSTYCKFQVNRAGRKCAEESAAFEGKARSAAKPAARTRTNRIGRALRVATPPAECFNTFESHPTDQRKKRIS